jgi:primase-polymerase (primpol)-like protein
MIALDPFQAEALAAIKAAATAAGRRRRGSVELYDGGRFFTLTGRHVAGMPRTLEERTAVLARFHRRLFAGTTPQQRAPHGTLWRCDPVCAADATLIACAHAARNGRRFTALWRGNADGYASRSEADLALCGLLAFWTGGNANRIDHAEIGAGCADGAQGDAERQ